MSRIAHMVMSSCLFVIGSAAYADSDYNQMGKLGYAHWDCASYASLAPKLHQEHVAHFEKGIQHLSLLLAAGRDGKLTKENTTQIPIGISWYFIAGPSIDFSLGNMWAQFSKEAHEDTWDDDVEGGFEVKKELQTMKAQSQFQEKKLRVASWKLIYTSRQRRDAPDPSPWAGAFCTHPRVGRIAL